ncbi:hypothetical protein Poly59_44580 [Rubripirellula reticaptiva]|uniref:Uncharacterized protein n=1 Tax=Rubripirellula reticaptiva TaxID=2528013 RepID=A0A5C6EJB6_9BACT|nr:hypothetical protein Poly59_44580 [Rubripirellula reticaptiva]
MIDIAEIASRNSLAGTLEIWGCSHIGLFKLD